MMYHDHDDVMRTPEHRVLSRRRCHDAKSSQTYSTTYTVYTCDVRWRQLVRRFMDQHRCLERDV